MQIHLHFWEDPRLTIDIRKSLSIRKTTGAAPVANLADVGEQKSDFGLQGGGTQYIREFWNSYFNT